MYNMSNERPWGPALMQFVRAELAARGVTAETTWAADRGINRGEFKKWADGGIPRIDKVAELAEALGRPLIDLLAAMSGIEPADVKPLRPPADAIRVTIESAIKSDPTLHDNSKRRLRGMVRELREWDTRHTE